MAIVGGGVTGCACAVKLAQAGKRVRLFEAREVAGGASGRNGGFALRGGAPAHDLAREELGAERARGLWVLTERYLDRLEALAGDAFRRAGSLRLAVDSAEAAELEAERRGPARRRLRLSSGGTTCPIHAQGVRRRARSSSPSRSSVRSSPALRAAGLRLLAADAGRPTRWRRLPRQGARTRAHGRGKDDAPHPGPPG